LDHHLYVARLTDTVALEDARCNGAGHAGCKLRCQLLWKHVWLELRNGAKAMDAAADTSGDAGDEIVDCVADRASCLTTQRDGRIVCQATELVRATRRLPWWDVRQYVRSLCAREVSLVDLLRIFVVGACNKVRAACGGAPLGTVRGRQRRTPADRLDLEPGECVEVKRIEEIAETLDVNGKNRGLAFVPEMRNFCGRRFRVSARVPCMVVEGTGELRDLRNTVILDSVLCRGIAQRGCPRACYHLWREAWLRRVTDSSERHSKTLQPKGT
jgi:hypothetical protein